MDPLLSFKHYTLSLIYNDELVRLPIFSNSHHVFLRASPCSEVEQEATSTGKSYMSTNKFYTLEQKSKNYIVLRSDFLKMYRPTAKPGNSNVDHITEVQKKKETFDPADLRKLHLQMKHGSATAMKD